MNEFIVHYDDNEDILYLGKQGEECEVIELAPGVNVELDQSGSMIGIELFRASSLLQNVIKSMEKKIIAA